MVEENAVKSKKGFVLPAVAVVLAIALVASIATQGFSSYGSTSSVTATAAGEKTITFINDYMLQEGQTALLDQVSEVSGMYLVNFTISGTKYSSYVSKDGNMMFPQVVDLNYKEEATAQNSGYDAPDSETPTVKFFIMSFCPYGQLAVKALKPSFDLLGNSVNFEPHYVIYDNYCGYGVPSEYCTEEGLDSYCIADGALCGMHGVAEVNENIREMCIYNNYPAETWWSYMDKMIDTCTLDDIEICWEGVAEEAGIDVPKIKTCLEDEGEALMTLERQQVISMSATASPTIFINNDQYSGSRSEEDLKNAICSGFSTEPSECSQELSNNVEAAEGGCG